MEPIRSQRAKWISRTLAAIAAVLGLKMGISLIQYLFSSTLTVSVGDLCLAFALVVLGTALCSFFFWLAVRLWTAPEPRHIRLWALMPAVLVFSISMWLSEGIESWLERHWSDADFTWIATEVATFVGLLLAGIVYIAVKRLLFFLLERTELIVPDNFRRHRKHYFWCLSFTLWGFLMSVCVALDDIYVDVYGDWWFPFAALLLPILLTVIIYKLCVRQFVTRPLRAFNQSPKDLNNGSPGCSAAEPGDRG